MSKRQFYVSMTILVAAADLAIAQYGGPSMLSRGGNSPGRRGRAPVDFVVYGAVRGTAESGLTAVQLDEQGNFVNNNVYGVQLEAGAYGSHAWRDTSLGLDYRGDYRQTTRSTNPQSLNSYNGTNQALSVDFQHALSKRVALVFRETAVSTNRAFGGFAAPGITTANSLNLANNEVFDTRTYISTTAGAVSYQYSARTSFIAGGDVFFVKRPDPRLVDLNGQRAVGVMEYRLSRRNSVSGAYTYMRYRYPNVYGGASMQGLALSFSRAISRNLSASISGGALKLDTFGTQNVNLSPEVAAILGRTRGVAAFNRTAYVPQASATVNYTMQRSSLFAAASTGVTPGNGVYQTSRNTIFSGGYSFAGTRKLAVGLSASHTRMSSQSIDVGGLVQTNAGLGFDYRLGRMFSLNSQFDWRKFNSPGLRGRSGYVALVGFSVSPTRLPLAIW